MEAAIHTSASGEEAIARGEHEQTRGQRSRREAASGRGQWKRQCTRVRVGRRRSRGGEHEQVVELTGATGNRERARATETAMRASTTGEEAIAWGEHDQRLRTARASVADSGEARPRSAIGPGAVAVIIITSRAYASEVQSRVWSRLRPKSVVGHEACRLDAIGAGTATGKSCVWCHGCNRVSVHVTTRTKGKGEQRSIGQTTDGRTSMSRPTPASQRINIRQVQGSKGYTNEHHKRYFGLGQRG